MLGTARSAILDHGGDSFLGYNTHDAMGLGAAATFNGIRDIPRRNAATAKLKGFLGELGYE